jgi:hypothetical protein
MADGENEMKKKKRDQRAAKSVANWADMGIVQKFVAPLPACEHHDGHRVCLYSPQMFNLVCPMCVTEAQDRGNKFNFEELDVAVDELAGMWVVRATDPIYPLTPFTARCSPQTTCATSSTY